MIDFGQISSALQAATVSNLSRSSSPTIGIAAPASYAIIGSTVQAGQITQLALGTPKDLLWGVMTWEDGDHLVT